LDLQIAFFCNECREGKFYDLQAAHETAARMKTPSVVVPNEYYSRDETIALLMPATVTVAQRYHFVIETVLAGSVPVSILRGQKMRGLARELGNPIGGALPNVRRNDLFAAILDATEHRAAFVSALGSVHAEMDRRARNNVSFLRDLPPYSSLCWDHRPSA
jgi:polysaccharide pyruvyl transferase WcaK-like protein